MVQANLENIFIKKKKTLKTKLMKQETEVTLDKLKTGHSIFLKNYQKMNFKMKSR